ncbi:MAG: HAD family hydrolase [candidate division WOR-3 bacterium]|jgi:putative hydrolase of the HAD superfamily
MLRAITFDLWTTIIEPIDYQGPRIEYVRCLLKRRGYSFKTKALQSAYSYSLERFCSVWQDEHRHMPSAQRLGFMIDRVGVELSREDLADVVKYFEETVLHDPPPLVAGAKLVLDSLYGLYELGLICDSGMSPGRVMREVLARLDLLSYFSATVFSDELGCTKPDVRMFKCALDQLGVVAQDAVHVGDLLNTDVAGAKAAGMKTVWLDWGRGQSGEASVAPDYRITRLADLLQIVAGGRAAS